MINGEIIELDLVGEYPNGEEKGTVNEMNIKSIEFGSNISTIKSYMCNYGSYLNLDTIIITSPNTIIEDRAFLLDGLFIHNLTLPFNKASVHIEHLFGEPTREEKGSLIKYVDIGYQIIIHCTDGSLKAVVNDDYMWDVTSI